MPESYNASELRRGAVSERVAWYEAAPETDSLDERWSDSAAGPITWLAIKELDSDITSHELPESVVARETVP